MENLDLSIVLPAYNESENLPDVLRGLKKALNEANIESEIIVVDNGSSDSTEEVLKSFKKEINELKTLRIEKNIGFGNGVLKGLETARGPILGYMVADGQVKSEVPVIVYQKLKQDNLEICRAIRISRDDGFIRYAVSKVYNFLFRLVFHSPFKDVNSGPKIFTRKFYETIKPSSKDDFLDSEILLKAKDNNFLVGEVGIASQARHKGRSSVSIYLFPLKFLRNMICWFLFKKIR